MWTCPACGALVDGDSFLTCWKCGRDRDIAAAVPGREPRTPSESLRFEVFRAGRFTSWEAMCADVAAFVTEIGRAEVQAITQSEDRGDAVLVVWYWESSG